MIDLQELVYAFNEYLGRDKYALYLHTNGAPDKAETRIVGTLTVGRVPYGFSTAEIDAESLNLTFTFDLPCGTDTDDLTRDKALLELTNKLLAWHTLLINFADGTSYKLNTFLEMQPPSAPYVDCGRITQQIVIAGTALAQNTNCGAVVGNDETIYIDGKAVLKLEKSSSINYTGDNNIPLSEGIYVPEIENIASVSTLKIVCLYMGSEIDKELYEIAEGVNNNPNKVYEITIERKDQGSITKLTKYAKLVSVANTSAAGVFLKYEATFQILGDAVKTIRE
jgi:hypothetical protein